MASDWRYQEYNALTLALSVFIICCLFILHYISRRVSLLPLSFRMISRKKRKMYCFDVDITLSQEGKKVRDNCTYLLRTVIVVVLCYIWQTCILKYRAFDLKNSYTHSWLQIECSIENSNCFGAGHSFAFFALWATPPNLCTKFNVVSVKVISDKDLDIHYRFVVCINFVNPDTINYTERLAIAFALSNMIVMLYETLVWLLYRYNSRVWDILVVVTGTIFIVFWVICIFIQNLFSFFLSWLGFVMMLSVPIILFCSRSAAKNLRCIQHKKLAIWRENAIKNPIDSLKEEELMLKSGKSQVLGSPSQTNLANMLDQVADEDCSSFRRSNTLSMLKKRSAVLIDNSEKKN